MYAISDWNCKISNYAEKTVTNGLVVSRVDNGFFVMLEEGLMGMANFVAETFIGDTVKVYIKKIDKIRRRISLKIIKNKPANDYLVMNNCPACEKMNRDKRDDFYQDHEYVSPFACYKDEERAIEKFNRNISLGQIAFDMEHGYTPIELLDVLKIVNDFKYVTSKQIAELLALKGVTEDIDIQKVMAYCAKKDILGRSRFVTKNGMRSNYYVYYISKNGYSILKQEGIFVKFRLLDLQDDAAKIKRFLSANQYAIYKMKEGVKYENLCMNQIVKVPFEEGSVARVNLINVDGKSEVFISVRRNPGWQDDVMDKITRIYHLLERNDETNIRFTTRPQISICVENEEHVEELRTMLNKDDINFICDETTNSYN